MESGITPSQWLAEDTEHPGLIATAIDVLNETAENM